MPLQNNLPQNQGNPPPRANNPQRTATRANQAAGVQVARDVLGHLYDSPTVALMLPYSHKLQNGEWKAIRLCFEHDPRSRDDMPLLQRLLLGMPKGGYVGTTPAIYPRPQNKPENAISTPPSVVHAAAPYTLSTTPVSRVSDAPPPSAVSASSNPSAPVVQASAVSTPPVPTVSATGSPLTPSTPKPISPPIKNDEKNAETSRYNTRSRHNRRTETPSIATACIQKPCPSPGLEGPRDSAANPSSTQTPPPVHRTAEKPGSSSAVSLHTLPKQPSATPDEWAEMAGSDSTSQPEKAITMVAVGSEQRLFYLPASKLIPFFPDSEGQATINSPRRTILFLPDEDPESFGLLNCWLQQDIMPSVTLTRFPSVTVVADALEDGADEPRAEGSDDGSPARKRIKTTTITGPSSSSFSACTGGHGLGESSQIAENMQFSLLKLARMGERHDWESLRKAAIASYREGEFLLNRPQPLGMRLDLAQSLFPASSTSRDDVLDIALELVRKNRRLEGTAYHP